MTCRPTICRRYRPPSGFHASIANSARRAEGNSPPQSGRRSALRRELAPDNARSFVGRSAAWYLGRGAQPIWLVGFAVLAWFSCSAALRCRCLEFQGGCHVSGSGELEPCDVHLEMVGCGRRRDAKRAPLMAVRKSSSTQEKNVAADRTSPSSSQP